jgi:spoIIIJ-associated protein
MAITIEMEGNTVEEAISAALNQLGVDRENTIIEVLEEEGKGFFKRISAGKAKVRVSIVDTGIEKAVFLIKEIMEKSNIDGNIEVIDSVDSVMINISGPDLGLMIGKRGETLGAVQTIVNIVMRKAGSNKKAIIDIEGYRKRRTENIVEIAKQAADKAVRIGKPVALKPMNSYDRRIVHIALQENEKILTSSEGEEPDRQIVIMPQ